VLIEVFDIGVAGQKPKQLVNDRLDVQLLGGDKGKAFAQIEAHLMTEHRERAGAGAILLGDSLGEDPLHKVLVLVHESYIESYIGKFAWAHKSTRRLGRRSKA
jgi:hypothetical protein